MVYLAKLALFMLEAFFHAGVIDDEFEVAEAAVHGFIAHNYGPHLATFITPVAGVTI